MSKRITRINRACEWMPFRPGDVSVQLEIARSQSPFKIIPHCQQRACEFTFGCQADAGVTRWKPPGQGILSSAAATVSCTRELR